MPGTVLISLPHDATLCNVIFFFELYIMWCAARLFLWGLLLMQGLRGMESSPGQGGGDGKKDGLQYKVPELKNKLHVPRGPNNLYHVVSIGSRYICAHGTGASFFRYYMAFAVSSTNSRPAAHVMESRLAFLEGVSWRT